MNDNFNIEIISPEKKMFSEKGNSVTIPSFEGEMTILADHISIITFLRPGIININENKKKFFVEDGIVEFKDNSLSILTSSIFNLDEIDKDLINKIIISSEKELLEENIDDQKRFLITQKIQVLKNITLN